MEHDDCKVVPIGEPRWRAAERQEQIERMAAIVRCSPTLSAEAIASLLYAHGARLIDGGGDAA
ncbi:hypothetical protein [Shewanella algae]|uniref:hypothetical protein n=1 Tax=Shewanella algae TaxID=38313 RepID=UPI0031F48311